MNTRPRTRIKALKREMIKKALYYRDQKQFAAMHLIIQDFNYKVFRINVERALHFSLKKIIKKVKSAGKYNG